MSSNHSLERLFVKTGIYSFAIGLLIGLVWVKQEYRAANDIGNYMTIAKPLQQYALELLRFASTITLASLFAAAVKLFADRRKDESFEFVNGFVKSFVVVFVMIIVVVPVLLWISIHF